MANSAPCGVPLLLTGIQADPAISGGLQHTQDHQHGLASSPRLLYLLDYPSPGHISAEFLR
jgi:hypothetical protein